MVSTYKRGKGNHGVKETSETNYQSYLQRNYASVHGECTPRWAQLNKSNQKRKKNNDSSDEDSDESSSQDESFSLSKVHFLIDNILSY